jgi:ribosome-associated protein
MAISLYIFSQLIYNPTIQEVILDTEYIKNEIVRVLRDKKAKNLISIDLKEITSLADYFVICTGTSDRHRKALADEVCDLCALQGIMVSSPIEGYRSTKWILVDCGDVVVHIFDKDAREKFNLEKLWGDGVLEDLREGNKEEIK